MIFFYMLVCTAITVVVSICLTVDYLSKLKNGSITYYNMSASVVICSVLSAYSSYKVLEWLFNEAMSGQTIQM